MAVPIRYTPEVIEEYTSKGYWRREIMADYWDRNARENPDKEAIVSATVRLTWSQAGKLINRIALGLLIAGLKKDDVLLMQLPNCEEYLLVRAACEKAGVVVALAPYTFRSAELRPVLQNIQAAAAIVSAEFRGFNYFDMMKELQGEMPFLKRIFVIGEKVPPGAISIKKIMAEPLETKYPADYLEKTRFNALETSRITITSGTTGTPKCSEETSAWTSIAGYADRMMLTRDDIVATFAPLTAGHVGKLVYIGAVVASSKIVILEHFTPEDACRLIEKEKITVAGMVPAMLARLVSYPDLNQHKLSSLRLIVTSTALLPVQIALEAEERLGCIVAQSYGSLDCGGIASHWVTDSREVRLNTVGKPYDGNEIKLVDENGKEVPAGEAGNVMVRGPQCTGGYYRQPEQTAKVWQTGWFNLGEVGRFDKDRNLILLGRKTDSINRGGYKIFPKEIEDLLVRHPWVADAAVVRMPDPIMGEKACAFVVLKAGQELTLDELVSFLKGFGIAPFKFPERLEVVPELPLAAGQKVNRRQLENQLAQKMKGEGST